MPAGDFPQWTDTTTYDAPDILIDPSGSGVAAGSDITGGYFDSGDGSAPNADREISLLTGKPAGSSNAGVSAAGSSTWNNILGVLGLGTQIAKTASGTGSQTVVRPNTTAKPASSSSGSSMILIFGVLVIIALVAFGRR